VQFGGIGEEVDKSVACVQSPNEGQKFEHGAVGGNGDKVDMSVAYVPSPHEGQKFEHGCDDCQIPTERCTGIDQCSSKPDGDHELTAKENSNTGICYQKVAKATIDDQTRKADGTSTEITEAESDDTNKRRSISGIAAGISNKRVKAQGMGTMFSAAFGWTRK
jgi:hypothetical protein